MATSGTEVFNVSRDDIINAALRSLGVLATGESASAEDRTNCAFALNLILKALPVETWLLWCYKDIAVPLTVSTASYTIGPSGVVVNSRPLRIAKAWMRDPNDNDIPMTQLARQDYDMLTPKNTPGIPVNYYYDPQLTNGVLYTWPVISVADYTMYISVQRTIQDIASTSGASSENFDLPQEWFQPLRWILADEISHEYSANLQKNGIIEGRADGWRDKMSNYSREEEGVYFAPNFQG
jgi:hypothetical protein